jgi:F-type H+-transporting ATPase subunit b
MPDRKAALAILLLVPFLLFMSAEGESRESGGGGMLGKVLNFAVLFGGLTFALYKPARNFLAKRTRDIQASLDEAREGRLRAEAKLEEARAKLAALEGDVARLRAQAEAEGRAETERIKALAEKEARRIQAFTQQEIDLQLKAGIQELKEYTAGLAASLAEARMKRRLTPDEQSGLIDKSIADLTELHEERRPD